jgi:UDP-N-acetyl-D-mannosaminuronate dehydrogenase
VDVVHVCIPCNGRDKFVDNVTGYVEQFKPKLVIIDSTVSPGTTMDVHRRCGGCLVAHSPVRGVHKSLEHMKWELKRWTIYVGGVNAESAEAARKHFEQAGFKTKVLKSSLETELAKLFETTYRAWMIACFQEMHRIARAFGANFDDAVEFLEDTHRGRLDRPLMFPDVIGGHCLIPNVELLLQGFDSKFLRLILESNEKRKKEMKDKRIQEEVDKVKERASACKRS